MQTTNLKHNLCNASTMTHGSSVADPDKFLAHSRQIKCLLAISLESTLYTFYRSHLSLINLTYFSYLPAISKFQKKMEDQKTKKRTKRTEARLSAAYFSLTCSWQCWLTDAKAYVEARERWRGGGGRDSEKEARSRGIMFAQDEKVTGFSGAIASPFLLYICEHKHSDLLLARQRVQKSLPT